MPEERSEWETLREQHFSEIRPAFAALQPQQRVLLFLPRPDRAPVFVARRCRAGADCRTSNRTIIGHLHSNCVLWKSKLLAGMPK
jgi:hypothetical protein